MDELKNLLLETTKNSFCNECGHNNCVQVVSWVSRPGFTETVPLTSKWIPCEEAETSMDKLISPDAEDFYWNIGCRDCNLIHYMY